MHDLLEDVYEHQIIAWITGTLTLLLALFSFILSFNALTDLAAQHQVSIPYLFPLVVEAGVVIFSLNALYRSLHGEHAKWQWLLILGSSLIAGGFNVLHAQPDLVSRTIAAMPSLFLLLSFESFLNQIKHGVERSTVLKNLDQLQAEFEQKRDELPQRVKEREVELSTALQTKQTELEQLQARLEQRAQEIATMEASLAQLQAKIEQAQFIQDSGVIHASAVEIKRDSLNIEQRRQDLLSILNTEGDIGATALASRLNISRGTVYSDLKALSEAGQVFKNGQGWEVCN